jgi:hypothetical protein
MAKATTFANDLLNAVYDTGASGTLALGPVSARVNYTLPFNLALLTTLSTAGAMGTEFAGGSYARISIAAKFGTPASAASIANTVAFSFTNMPSGTWADAEVLDSTGTPKRMNFKGTPSLAKTVNTGDTCSIAIGGFTGTEV